jgi:hypothetical protein
MAHKNKNIDDLLDDKPIILKSLMKDDLLVSTINRRKKDYIRFYNMPYLLVIFMYIGIAISIFALFAYIIPL